MRYLNYDLLSQTFRAQASMLTFKSKSYIEFNAWCKTEPSPKEYKQYDFFGNRPVTRHSELKSGIENVNLQLREGKLVNLIFNKKISPSEELEPDCAYTISGNDSKDSNSIFSLTISVVPDQECPLVFRNLKIRNSIIHGKNAGMKGVIFDNCDIAKLLLQNDAKVTLINTKIGTLVIQQANLIDMEGGCVLNIEITAPGGANPLSGSIDFVNTFFPNNRKDYLLPGPQPYRNMRYHLRSIENGQMANLFHSAELAVERERDTGMNKFLSYGYQIFSDFGSSATRPIVSWFLLGIVSAIIIFFTNGATPAFETDKYPGWKAVLVADNCGTSTNLAKATYLSFSTMLNPLGQMGHRALLVPSKRWTFIMLIFQALLSAILIALMILAIRRRFKM